MALQWKRNSRYPSITRPGVFPRIQEFDDEGNDILEDTWFELTGIDEEEINKFKFALGTWTHISRRNRKIRILPASDANTITYPITADEDAETTEPKPNYRPEGFLPGFHSPYAWAKNKAEEYGYNLDNGETTKNSHTMAASIYPEGKRGNLTIQKPSGGDYVIRYTSNEKVTLRFHDHDYWEQGYWRTENIRAPLVGPGPYHVHKGDVTSDRIWQCYKQKTDNRITNVRYYYRFRANIADPKWRSDTKYGQPSNGFQWFWLPSNSEITDPQTGLTAYGDWVEGGSLVETQNQASSDDQYVGLVTKSPIQNVLDIEQDDLFLYHEIGSDDYKNASAPLEVYFSLNFLERDESLDIVKYIVLEWGDEEEQMSDQEILDSEFFYVYESDDSVFDGTKYKKLCLIASEAAYIAGEEIDNPGETNDRGALESHIYIEPGIKTIKTIVFRFDTNEEFLLETSIVYTNIFVADPNQKIQDFNIFGAQDYSVLPLERELEPIIGNIDKRSEYVRSIEKIKNNDLFEASDYLEKIYTDDFLPKVNNDLYGKYAGNIDLGITRVFKKPYNIFDFIGGDALEIINNNFEYPQDSLPLNSSATEILIDNGDCVVELNPSNQNNDQIENTALSDEKGVLMGDYRLVKNPEQEIRRDNSMAIPKINTQKKRQAF